MSSELSYLIRSIFESILTFAVIITPIVLFFIGYIRNKRAEHELRMRLLENGSDPELAKVLIESKLKREPKLVMLRIGLPAIFASFFGSGFVVLLNNFATKEFEGAVLLFILMVVFGIGLGLVAALSVERKLLKKAE